jgi:hypothetical protein
MLVLHGIAEPECTLHDLQLSAPYVQGGGHLLDLGQLHEERGQLVDSLQGGAVQACIPAYLGPLHFVNSCGYHGLHPLGALKQGSAYERVVVRGLEVVVKASEAVASERPLASILSPRCLAPVASVAVAVDVVDLPQQAVDCLEKLYLGCSCEACFVAVCQMSM